MAPVNAATDPESGLRKYGWCGRQLLSVTSLRPSIGYAQQLHQWIVAQNIDAALILSARGELPAIDIEEFEALRALSAKGNSAAKKKLADFRRPIRQAGDTERDLSGDLGTRIHKAAEMDTDLGAAEDDVRPFLRQYYAAKHALDLEVLLAEAQVWNLAEGYAGTLDILGRLTLPHSGERITAIVDLKSGKDVHVDAVVQDLLYALAEFVGQDDIVNQQATAMLHETQAIAVLHLRPTHWELLEFLVTDEARRAALDVARLANFLHRHPRIDNLVASRTRGEA